MISDLSIILPTLNESGNIIRLMNKIIHIINPKEIIIVDDNSADGTAVVVKHFTVIHPQVKLIVNKPPLGLTASLQKGIDSAGARNICWMDADFSHPPEILPSMLKSLRSADIAVGSWLVPGGADLRKETAQKISSKIINSICSLLFGRNIRSYTSGYIMTKKTILANFRLQGQYGEYCIDFLVRQKLANHKIREVPFNCISRKTGLTKTSPNLWVFFLKGKGYLTTVIKLTIYKIITPSLNYS